MAPVPVQAAAERMQMPGPAVVAIEPVDLAVGQAAELAEEQIGETGPEAAGYETAGIVVGPGAEPDSSAEA